VLFLDSTLLDFAQDYWSQGKRVRLMCLPGIKEADLISVADGGLSIVVDSATSFHRVPIYQRYHWELMDNEDLDGALDLGL
jgi:hypothetical protein